MSTGIEMVIVGSLELVAGRIAKGDSGVITGKARREGKKGCGG